MKQKHIKAFFAIDTFAALSLLLAGCNSVNPKIVVLNDKLTDIMGEVTQIDSLGAVNDFALIGADVTKSAFLYNVSFNGVASYGENDNKAFATTSYTVPSSEFNKLKKESSTDNLFTVMNNIADNYTVESYTVTPVNSLENISTAIVKNSPCPFDDYTISKGIIYSLSNPTFNDENQTATFGVKELVELRKSSNDLGFGIGFGSRGVGFGIGYVHDITEGTFTITDTYSLSADSSKYEELKNDPKLVFDYLQELIASNDESKIYADRLNVNDVTYSNADLLGKINLKDQDQNLGMEN